jgi:CheY-like chemotaxis protein
MLNAASTRHHDDRMKMHAIIVDDNVEFLRAACRLLEREGVIVAGTASNSAEAIQAAEEHRPDVILVDIDLGEENGFELAERLSSATGPSAPVVLISSYPEEDLVELIDASPAVGFVSKSRLSAALITDLLDRAREAACRKAV